MEKPQALGIKNPTASKSAFSGDNVALALTNQDSAAEDQLLALTPGWHDTAGAVKTIDGTSASAIIKDGQIVTTATKTVVGNGKNCKINDVVKMFQHTPVFLKGIKVQVDNVAQLEEEIQVVKLGPAGVKEIARITPSSFKNEANMDDKLVSIDLMDMNIVLGIDTAILMNLGAGRKTNLTIYYKNKMGLRDMARYANDRINQGSL